MIILYPAYTLSGVTMQERKVYSASRGSIFDGSSIRSAATAVTEKPESSS